MESMDYWDRNLPDLEREAEHAMQSVDRTMKGVDEARGFLSRAQAHAASQLPPAQTINAPGNRHVRPARLSVVSRAPIESSN
jgi:hypothetical protein